jgi:predicted nucleic acid-binding protein
MTITLDTGALIGLERRHARIVSVIRYARKHERAIVVPAAVITEWWRGRTDVRENIVEMVDVEPLDPGLARLAGEAIAAVPGAGVVDAIVMASASRKGSVVYTSDVEDLMRLQRFFPSTRLSQV